MNREAAIEECESCRFYLPRKDIEYLGYCRRFPPTLTKKFYQSGNADGAEGGFPQSRKNDWCGEWMACQRAMNGEES